jgi:hypothetical protein
MCTVTDLIPTYIEYPSEISTSTTFFIYLWFIPQNIYMFKVSKHYISIYYYINKAYLNYQ